MTKTTAFALTLPIGLLLWLPEAALANTRNPCKQADRTLARTGRGDLDADGLSDCREKKLLLTRADDADTDDDGLDDGQEMERSCDPRDSDTDDDGLEDGEDESPAIEQEVEALLDALTCPMDGTPGSITALGITAAVGADTDFECDSCEALASRLALGEDVFVEIEILEDVLGALTATEVEVRDRDRCGVPDDDEGDEDDQGEDDDDQGEDDDDQGEDDDDQGEDDDEQGDD